MKTKNTLRKLSFLALIALPFATIAQWTELHPGAGSGYNCIDCIDSKNCFLGGTTGGFVYKTTDGMNWTDVSPSSNSNVLLQMLDKDTVYVINNNSQWWTFNGGQSWTEIPITNAAGYFFVNSQIGFGSSGPGVFYVTSDGGNNWIWKNTLPAGVDAGYVMDFLNENIGFMAGLTSTTRNIYKTTDGGNSWIAVFTKNNTTSTVRDIQMITSQVGFACGLDGMILKTTDGGDSWVELANPYQGVTSAGFKALDFINTNSGYVVSQANHILKTTDGGSSWIDESLSYNGINDVKVVSLDSVFVATGSIDKLLLNDTANLVLNIMNNEQIVGEIYPNPVFDKLTIEIEVPDCKIIILDMNGKVLIERELQIMTKQQIDFSDLKSGMYLYQITNTNGLVNTGKISKNFTLTL